MIFFLMIIIMFSSTEQIYASEYLVDSETNCQIYSHFGKVDTSKISISHSGLCSKGFAHGKGKTVYFKDQRKLLIVDGQYSNGKLDGTVTFVGYYENGNKQFEWSGDLTAGIMNGYVTGTDYYENGGIQSTFSGLYKNDKRHGKGEMTWFNDNREVESYYRGMYENGRRHGQGESLNFKKFIYSGQWLNGKKHGQGSVTFPDGSSYTGIWKNGKRVDSNSSNRIEVVTKFENLIRASMLDYTSKMRPLMLELESLQNSQKYDEQSLIYLNTRLSGITQKQKTIHILINRKFSNETNTYFNRAEQEIILDELNKRIKKKKLNRLSEIKITEDDSTIITAVNTMINEHLLDQFKELVSQKIVLPDNIITSHDPISLRYDLDKGELFLLKYRIPMFFEVQNGEGKSSMLGIDTHMDLFLHVTSKYADGTIELTLTISRVRYRILGEGGSMSYDSGSPENNTGFPPEMTKLNEKMVGMQVMTTISSNEDYLDYNYDSVQDLMSQTNQNSQFEQIRNIIDQMIEGIFIGYPDMPQKNMAVWQRGKLTSYLPDMGSMTFTPTFQLIGIKNNSADVVIDFDTNNTIFNDEESKTTSEISDMDGGGWYIVHRGFPIEAQTSTSMHIKSKGNVATLVKMKMIYKAEKLAKGSLLEILDKPHPKEVYRAVLEALDDQELVKTLAQQQYNDNLRKAAKELFSGINLLQ